MPQPVDRYTWQQAICSEQGPPNATARLVLLAISLHMDAAGMNAWPAQTTLARRALINRRSVITHLQRAERDGWVARYDAGRNGQGWRLSGYEARVPDTVYSALPDKPWETDPNWKRGERTAPPMGKRGEPNSPAQAEKPQRGENGASDVVNLTTERGASGAKGGEPGSHESSLLNLPSESSLKGKVRLPRTLDVGNGIPKAEEQERRAKILHLTTKGFGAGDIAKFLKTSGVTLEEVRRVQGAK